MYIILLAVFLQYSKNVVTLDSQCHGPRSTETQISSDVNDGLKCQNREISSYGEYCYPAQGEYQLGEDCTWNILPRDTPIKMAFTRFNIEDPCDHVTLTGDSGDTGKHTGQDVAPSAVKSQAGHGIMLHFESDSKHINCEGFCIVVSDWCDGTCKHGVCTNGKCTCSAGYKGRTCESDINECKTGKTHNGGCNQTCNNNQGSFTCTCHKGYQLGKDQKSCSDINECEVQNDCSHVCTNTPGSYKCSCPPHGWYLDHDERTCEAGYVVRVHLPNAWEKRGEEL